MTKLHLISGLPRSGSTLLAALLRQNPRFMADMTSPVAMLCGTLMQSMGSASEFASFFSDQRREILLRAVFEAYYAEAGRERTVFDTNRSWTAKTALLDALYPEARIICCVREVSWILDSIERLVRANPLQPSKMFNHKTGGSIYSRIEMLMEPEKGLVGLAWSSLREAWFSESARRLIVIRYDTLARHPQQVMRRLYEELGEVSFAHDFDNIAYDASTYDTELGMPGLHRVRPKVEYCPRETCLPPNLFAKYAEVNFWLNTKMNSRNVTVL